MCVPRLPDTHNPVAHAIHARYDAVRHRTNSSAAPPSQMRADRALRSWDAAALRGREDAVVGHPPAPLLWRTSAAAGPPILHWDSSFKASTSSNAHARGLMPIPKKRKGIPLPSLARNVSPCSARREAGGETPLRDRWVERGGGSSRVYERASPDAEGGCGLALRQGRQRRACW